MQKAKFLSDSLEYLRKNPLIVNVILENKKLSKSSDISDIR
jgi:hypothetical protein